MDTRVRVSMTMKIVVGMLPLCCLLLVVFFMSSETTQRPATQQISGAIRDVDRCRHSESMTLDMVKLFRFLPRALRQCDELFAGNRTYTSDFTTKFEAYEKIANEHNVDEGYTASASPYAYKAFLALVQAPFVKTVCETGFNAGHGTFGWLTMNPDVHVYSFDIGEHSYSRPMAKHLRKLYPGRLNVTWGDSVTTLPHFIEHHPDIKCDLIFIDGGHSYSVCKSDLFNFLKMSNKVNLVILDDIQYEPMEQVWEEVLKEGSLVELFSCANTKSPSHHIGVGMYTPIH